MQIYHPPPPHTHTHSHTHAQLIKIEEIATLNHLVEVVTFTVKNRQSKKCRTTLMISDASVELVFKEQVSSRHTLILPNFHDDI